MVRNNGTQVRKDGTQKMEVRTTSKPAASGDDEKYAPRPNDTPPVTKPIRGLRTTAEAFRLELALKFPHQRKVNRRRIRNGAAAAETPTIIDGRKKTVGNEKRSDGRVRASPDVDDDPDDKKRTDEPQENAGIHAIQGKIRQSRWKGTKNEKSEPTIKIGLGGKRAGAGAPLGNTNAVKHGERSRQAFFTLAGAENSPPLVSPPCQ